MRYAIAIADGEKALRELVQRDEADPELVMAWYALEALRELLQISCVHEGQQVQQMKPIEQCRHLLKCRVSVKGTTRYCVVWAETQDQALQMGSNVLGWPIKALELDLED